MSQVEVQSPSAIVITEIGVQGAAGIDFKDDWASAVLYRARDTVLHDGTSYRAIIDHVASASTEPGVGASWGTAWKVLALGSDVASVAAVAQHVGAIETVAGNVASVTTVSDAMPSVIKVAGLDAEIGTVAARDVDIGKVAARDAAIQVVASRDGDIGVVAGISSDVARVSGLHVEIETIAGISSYVVAVVGIGADVQTVASIASQIQTAASISASIQAVADLTYAAAVVSVSSNMASVLAAAQNMSAIIAAPGAAAAAASSANQAATNAALSIKTVGVRTVGNVVISGSGTPVGNSLVYFQPASVKDYDEYVTGLPVAMSAAGKLRIVISKLEADGTFSDAGIAPVVVDAPAGLAGVTGLAIPKPANCAVGIQIVSGGVPLYTTGTIPGGEERWTTPTVPTSHTAKTVATSNGVQFQAVLTAKVAAEASAAYGATGALGVRIDQNTAAIGGEQRFGWADPIVGSGSSTTAGYTIVPQFAMPANGRISEVTIGAGAAATLKLMAVTMAGTTVSAITYSQDVNVAAGVNVIAVDIPMVAGQYLVISGANIRYQANANPQAIPIWIRLPVITTPPIAVNDVLTSSTAHRFEVAFKFQSGVKADVAKALASGGGNSGLTLLQGADHSAGADATAAFNAASLKHPFPYVDPGSFSVTTALATLEGLWGPGVPRINGERAFLPERPEIINLYDAVRASLAEHIANNDVIGLAADSRGHFANASIGTAHHFNLITRFVNLWVAADDPLMTALRPSSTYFPSFYGVYYTYGGTILPNSTAWAAATNYSVGQVVLSGSGTYLCNTAHTSGATFDGTNWTLVASTGSRGPLGESLILADGAGISFVGAHEQIDVHYTQDAGQGSLNFAFNGAVFKTVSAAGALVLDQFSGPSMTGQTASGTYTVTASGGPVEITSLVRLGVKVAGSRPRVRTARFAHGSYTIASFNSARLASMIKQATYAGGKLIPDIDLGINDSFGTVPASIATNLSGMLDTFEAAGCDRIIVRPPTRPSSTWNSSYTGGRTYDAALGAIRGVLRGRNVQVINADGSDYINTGKYSDGLHFNDAGNDLHALRWLKAVAATTPANLKASMAAAKAVDDLDIQINGRMIGTKLIEASGASQSPSLFKAFGLSNGDVVKWRVKAKAAELGRLNLFANGSNLLINQTFDLVAGTVASGGSNAAGLVATIVPIGNGWYQCEINGTSVGAGSANYQHRLFHASGAQPLTGDGVSGLYIGETECWINGQKAFVSTRDFSVSEWTKQHISLQANAALFIGALAPLFGVKNYNDGSAILFGKKWAALGSSITIGAYYAALMAGQTGMVLTNLGVSGSALGLSTTGYPSYGMSARIADIPLDTELVTIEAGPNAFGAQETPLGTFGDTSYATHYGSLWRAILDIRARVPNAKIVGILTYSGGPGHATHRLGRTNGQGKTMDQYMRAEREVYEALGIPYLDTSRSGVGYATADLFTNDWLHPNAAGSLRLATNHSADTRDLALRGLFVN